MRRVIFSILLLLLCCIYSIYDGKVILKQKGSENNLHKPYNKYCIRSGPKCVQGCSVRLLCKEDEDGQYALDAEICKADESQFCDEEKNACSAGYCRHFEEELECTDGRQIRYPHPTRCRDYYICFGDKPYLWNCYFEYMSFNSKTGVCDLLVADAKACTEGPLPACTELDQSGPNPYNPNLYYVCKSNEKGYLYHHQYACLDGHIYDGKDCKPTTSDLPLHTTREPTTPPSTTATECPECKPAFKSPNTLETKKSEDTLADLSIYVTLATAFGVIFGLLVGVLCAIIVLKKHETFRQMMMPQISQ